ncbi:CLUMA_CG014324, isoform A [Clunio marinus]|uniref:CLUMA_CG014324, isoform A n=1 Tax=Clunio marinus TaxID=568069 RepID=A0A1J1IMA2_9DIPT|nr:CLUMA_CG014324, isoform A [Clunio marinus]
MWLESAIKIIILCLSCAFAMQSGSPKIEGEACLAMMPNHHVDPQSIASPYQVIVSSTSVHQGEILKIVITDPIAKTAFKGFAIQGRDVNNYNKTIGSFLKGPEIKVVECKWKASAVTNCSAKSKTRMEIEWKAPLDFIGDIQFYATLIKDFVTIWIDVKSELVTITE